MARIANKDLMGGLSELVTNRKLPTNHHKSLPINEQINLLKQQTNNCTNVKEQAAREKSRIESSLICNLSDLRLSNFAISLLNKGYSFAPKNTKLLRTHVDAVNNSIEKFVYQISSRLNSVTYARPRAIKSSNLDFSFKAALNRTLSASSDFQTSGAVTSNNLFNSLAIRNLRQNFQNCSSNVNLNVHDNLLPEERAELRAFKSLCLERKIAVRKADKSQQIVIMNYLDYEKGMQELLNNTANYEIIPFNKKFEVAAKITALIKSFQGILFDQKQIEILLQNTKRPENRLIYGLPKTHKPREKWNKIPPLRPIVPDLRTETAVTGKLIAFYLAPIFVSIRSYIKNSYDLVQLLGKFQTLPETAVVLVADIDNLYPSLPIRSTHTRVISAIRTARISNSPFELDFVSRLLKIQLETNCFVFGEKCYRQINGIPMGKAWAPAVASIYLEKWEKEIFRDSQIEPLIYLRYIDDILCVLSSTEEAELLIRRFQTHDVNIRLSEYSISKSVHFLDVSISIEENRFVTSVYTKPSHLQVLLDFNSAHSYSLKCNVILSQLIRIYRLNSNLIIAGQSMYIFIKLMTALRNLSPRTARKIWGRFLNWLHRQGSPRPPTRIIPLQLTLPNNVIDIPFRKAYANFAQSLSHTDELALGALHVRNSVNFNLGRSLFVA
jgi:hypothetical protein